jgi:hypothetical protein
VAVDVDSVLARLKSVSLEDIDERAALLRRVDHKYLVERDILLELLDELSHDHDVLEIDGRRRFAYASVYFDTPDLRCFHEHVHGTRPRFKTRTRHYVDTGNCVFEVKLKNAQDESAKRQIDHDANARDRLTPAALRLTREALTEAGVKPPQELRPTVQSSFDRVTLAAREGGARLTCDLGVRLSVLRGSAVGLQPSHALLESKSEDGESPADRALERLGAEPVSLSKYRTAVALLVIPDPTRESERLRSLFDPEVD